MSHLASSLIFREQLHEFVEAAEQFVSLNVEKKIARAISPQAGVVYFGIKVRWDEKYILKKEFSSSILFSLIFHRKSALWMDRDSNDLFDRQSESE